MSKDPSVLPTSRTWRDIPQQVRPRAMSREGRRRVTMGVWRTVAGVATVAGAVWCAWSIAAAIQGNQAGLPSSARPIPLRPPELKTNGVLDRAWLARVLALPKGATLMGLDLAQLRIRLLAEGQVKSAELSRKFPDTLVVRILERSPMARLMAQFGSEAPRSFLVARDGVAFPGINFDSAMVETLPWLDGVRPVRRGTGLEPIAGMEKVSDLLATAQLQAGRLYRSWQVVSLARLGESDGEIEVKTRDGLKIVFGANEDFLRQLARLDVVLDSIGDHPPRPLREINLALGSQVPVSFGAVGAPADAAPTPVSPTAPAAGRPAFILPAFPDFHSHP